MIAAHAQANRPLSADWRRYVAIGAAPAGVLLLAGLFVSQYVGHSSSPYGVCYAASGRSVPCELAKPRR